MSIETVNLDTNHDSKLDKQEIEKWTGIELSSLKETVINKKLNELAPNYESDFKNISIEKKKEYLILFSYSKKILGNNFYNEFLKKNGEYTDIPLDEMISFISESLLNEQNKELLQTKEIILTTDELEKLHKILARKTTKGKLQDFLTEQINEDTTSAEIIQGTSFAKKIEELGKNPTEFIKNIDTVWFHYLQNNLSNTSKDTLRNMATGITFTFIKIFKDKKGNIPEFFKNIEKPAELFKSLTTKEGITFLNKTNLIIDAIKNIKNEEENAILMDPQKFSEFYYNILTGKKSKEEIKKKLKNAGKYEKNNIDIDKLKDISNLASNHITKKNLATAGSLAGLGAMFSKVKNIFGGLKKKIKKETLENANSIFKLKDFLENMGIFKNIKDFFNKIFKLLGFKDGWDGFEKEAESKSSPDITKYFKKNLTLQNIQQGKLKKTIFHDGFKNHLKLTGNKIQQLKVKGRLSYESFKYLHKIGGDEGNTNITENLNNFFTTRKFNTLFENDTKAKDDFYKKTFTIEKNAVNGNKTKINIGVIDFDTIDKVIKKVYKKEDVKNQKKSNIDENLAITGFGAGVKEKIKTNKKVDSIEHTNKGLKENIETFNNKKEIEFKKLVNNLWGIKNFSYTRYINAIGIRESNGNYSTVNNIGALGKYQFMPNTLKDYKDIICKDSDCNEKKVFLNTPIIQEKVMATYTLDHIKQINGKVKIKNDKELVKYLAKAHLGGVGNISKNKTDSYGTTQIAYANDVINYYTA